MHSPQSFFLTNPFLKAIINYKQNEIIIKKLHGGNTMSIEIIAKNTKRHKNLPNVMYVPVVNDKELTCMAETEDVAMLLGLQHKYDGADSQFTKMACRMLGIDSMWSK